MLRAHFVISISSILALCSGEEQHKRLKFHRLTDLTVDQYDQIFEPNYHDDTKTAAQGHIELSDEFGQFMTLSYESRHPINTNILKLEDGIHANRIQSVLCSLDDDQTEVITLNFTSTTIAEEYYNDIQSSLAHPRKKHFITAGHKYHCNGQSILKQITQIASDDTKLTVYSKQAKLQDLFETLSISYETNVQYSPYPTHVSHGSHPRRLSAFWGTLWSDAVNGLKGIIRFIKALIHDMDVSPIVSYVMNEPIVYGPKEGTKSWSWNYQRRRPGKTIKLAENVSCHDCFVSMDVTYKYQLNITDRRLQYLLLTLEGEPSIGAGIEVDGGITDNEEYRVNTPHFTVFALTIAGVGFKADLYGQIGLGVYGSLDDFSFDIGVTGHVRKGIEFIRNEYAYVNSSGYHYINEHSLHFDKPAPKATVTQGSMSGYIRPALYFQLSPIGSFYFGLQPTYTFQLRMSGKNSCPLHWSSSPKTTVFIGAELEITEWKKRLSYGTLQSNLKNSAGCIDKSDIIHSQVSTSIVDMVEGVDGRRRLRSADGVDVPSVNEAVTYVDFSSANVIPNFSLSEVEPRFSEYWGNLSSIPTLCNDYAVHCNGYITDAVTPHYGHLLLSKSMQNGSWIAIYRTELEIVPDEQWDFLTPPIITNVSCTARHQFDLVDENPDDAIVTFNVKLLEWYCDTDEVHLGLNKTLDPREYASWECLISLPETMTAIASSPSFATMMLFDAPNWCHVFTLHSKPRYILSDSQVEAGSVGQYMYPLWYGTWNCPNMLNKTDNHVKLYFISYNESTSQTEAILHYGSMNHTLYLKGHMDLVEMEMELKAMYWYEQQTFFKDMNVSLTFIGLLRISSDGSIVYAGSVEHEECTGFVFHGSLNLTKAEANLVRVPEESNVKGMSTEAIAIVCVGAGLCCVMAVAGVALWRLRRKRRSTPSYIAMNDVM